MPAGNLQDSVTQIPEQTVASRGWVVRSPWARNLLTFLMVFGPGLIVMEADNDAGAVSTYVQAGAGLVADSVPEKEYTETVNKARALLTALEIAHRGEDPAPGANRRARTK